MNFLTGGLLWLPLSLLSAFFHASGDAVIKSKFQRFTPYQMVFLSATSAVPILLALLFFIPIPELSPEFYKTVLIMLPFEITAYYFYMLALKFSPISLTVPFLSFTPVFMIVTGWIILGEKINLAGMAGIFCVVVGAYLLNLQDINKGLLRPFKVIFHEKGCVYMLIVAFIYSISASFGKKVILLSEPVFFSCFYYIVLGLIIPPVFFLISKGSFKERINSVFPGFKGIIWAWLLNGIITSIMIVTHSLAISMVNAAYMIAVKRTNVIFTIFYGKFLFKEENIFYRFLGSILMILGICIIAAFGK